MSFLVDDDVRRCELLGRHLAEKGGTVRSVALLYGVSKSTVHKDVTERLKIINRPLYDEVRKVLDENKAERHLRGGEATKRKYEKEKKN